MRYVKPLFVLILSVLGWLSVTCYSAYDIQEGGLSPVWNHIRSESPTHVILHIFDIKNDEMAHWFIKNRFDELYTLENAKIIESFSGDWVNLEKAMWNRSNKVERFALLFRQIAHQSPCIYQLFWKRLYNSFFKEHKRELWPYCFRSIASEYRALFLEGLILKGSFARDEEMQEQVVKDFSWLCSHGILTDMKHELLSSLLRYAHEYRSYAKKGVANTIGDGFSEQTWKNKRRRINTRTNQISFIVPGRHQSEKNDTESLNALTDPDKWFENICMRFLDKGQVLSLVNNYLDADTDDKELLTACIKHAVDWEKTQKQLRDYSQKSKLGSDWLQLQQAFCYP